MEINYYNSLIEYLHPDNPTVIIIADGFWEKKKVNRLIEEYALESRSPFVSIKDLSKNYTNMAIGKYEHKGDADDRAKDMEFHKTVF